MAETIAGWSPAELRRYVVNTILTDPGAIPENKDTSPSLPAYPADGDVPVWDAGSGSWVSSTKKAPTDTNPLVKQLPYIRVQGGISGFIADLNFRVYNLSSPSIIMENDPNNQLGLSSGQLTVAAGNYMFGVYVVGRAAAAYEAAWTLTYNGVTIDVTIQNTLNMGGVGAAQSVGLSASGVTNFFASAGGNVQLSGFQNDATITAAGMWAVRLP